MNLEYQDHLPLRKLASESCIISIDLETLKKRDHINSLKIKLNNTKDLGLIYKHIVGNCSLNGLLLLIIHNNNIPGVQICTILMFVIYVIGQRFRLCSFQTQLPAVKQSYSCIYAIP
ncbi:hypothetical protein V1478_005080 [Vespula squamosa]|uniref:Uncharacterized protein n=1 Tax=Vespula squamosa TaxID=30214 RepID=A0ABD2BD48_VESSQ